MLTVVSHEAIDAKWNNPQQTTTNLEVKLYYGSGQQLNHQVPGVVAPGQQSKRITGLSPFTQYTVKVCIEVTHGQSYCQPQTQSAKTQPGGRHARRRQ